MTTPTNHTPPPPRDVRLKLATVRLLLQEGQRDLACALLRTLPDKIAAPHLAQLHAPLTMPQAAPPHGPRRRWWWGGAVCLLVVVLATGWGLGYYAADPVLYLPADATQGHQQTIATMQPRADAIHANNLTVEALLLTATTAPE